MTIENTRLPKSAMILAAGKGTRMRPLTDRLPKPLLQIAGRPMIDYVLDVLAELEIDRCVVNLHHCPDPLREHLDAENRLQIIFSDETDCLLDSGGGIRKALPHLGADPFYVLNGDAPLFTQGAQALSLLYDRYLETRAQAVLLLVQKSKVPNFDGPGDYNIASNGQAHRQPGPAPGDFIFTGAQLLAPSLFDAAPADPVFSSVQLFDRAEEQGRLQGASFAGRWFQINTSGGLAFANAEIFNLTGEG